MNTSDLEIIWRKQSLQAPDVEKIALIVDTIGADDRKFRSAIWWRDFREIGAAVLFAIFSSLVSHTWLKWISVGSFLFIAAYLWRSRTSKKDGAEPLNLAAKLERMLVETDTQIRLLRSVLWWYLLPVAIAYVAFLAERTIFRSSSLSFLST